MRNVALSLGAEKAAFIAQGDIVLSPTFRAICRQNNCGQYGRCHMCPPDIGPIEHLMEKVRSYEKGLVYQTIHCIEDSFDIEGMLTASHAHALCSRRIHEALEPQFPSGFLHLSVGGCRVCPICTKPDGVPCRFPSAALPSLEGYGVDVYQSIKNTTLAYINGPHTVTYFGLLLFREAEHGHA